MPVSRWTIKSLQESPRLHVFADDTGAYRIRSADDVDLYSLLDARRLPASDPLHTSLSTHWRCFLRDHATQQVVTEFRRHCDLQSAVSMTVFQEPDKAVKTGLEWISGGYVPTRYRLKWTGNAELSYDYTIHAPNTTMKDPGSLRCYKGNGKTLAWLSRDMVRAEEESFGPPTQRPVATIWFEEEGIDPDLIEVVVSGLLAITDVQYPLLVRPQQ